MGLIFWSALPEELDWSTRTEDVALSLDAIKRFLTNMLVALDRDTPQTKQDSPPTLQLRSQAFTRNRLGSGLRSRNWDSPCSWTNTADHYTRK